MRAKDRPNSCNVLGIPLTWSRSSPTLSARRATCGSRIFIPTGDEKSAGVPEESVDVALIPDTYPHFNYPAAMMASVKKALRPGGRVAMVEHHKSESVEAHATDRG
jgi:predicted methyltransferase